MRGAVTRTMVGGLVAAVLSLPGPAAHAIDPPPRPGAVVERILHVGGKQVPLPEGRWIVAGSAAVPYEGGARIGAYGAIRNVVLFHLRGRAVDAAIELNTNELPVTDGWGIAEDCSRTDLALAAVRYKAGWDGSCFFVTHTLTQARRMPAAWEEAAAFARREGLVLSPEWLTVGMRVANRRDVVDARYHFSTITRGFEPALGTAWAGSPWAAARIEREPDRLAFARDLTEWGMTFSGFVESGIKRRLDPEATLPMPATTAVRDTRSVVERRLAALADLQRAGVIGREQYDQQVARLVERGLDPGSEVVDPATVALYKTLSYRPMVSLANVFIDYYWIGAPFAAGVLVLLQVTVNTTKYYFHELAWESIAGGGTRRDSARTIDFDYFGTNS
ncbi:MAG: DUF2061 domain-containing protein [Alphaproteobacteria bacterium]|nr:DUF2061 domain-containing protein [Alphaproteobacteria bacterium]